jgi:hypothetical protein
MEREVLMFRRGKGGLDELKQSHNNQMRAVTVAGQIMSCPARAVQAHARLIAHWEHLTGLDWEKEHKPKEK